MGTREVREVGKKSGGKKMKGKAIKRIKRGEGR